MNLEGAKKMPKHAALREGQPNIVRQAITARDHQKLSRLGRSGAIKAHANRELNKAFDERRAEQRATEDAQVREDTNENIVPFDPEDERDEK